MLDLNLALEGGASEEASLRRRMVQLARRAFEGKEGRGKGGVERERDTHGGYLVCVCECVCVCV